MGIRAEKIHWRGQRGAALIAALLMAALVSMLAVGLAVRQQLDIRRTANMLHGDQALLVAKGMERWGALLLARSSEQEVLKILGQPMPPMPVPGGLVTGRLEDLQGRFNVNNLVLVEDKLVQELSRQQFKRLLALCGMEEDLEQAVTDWLDTDQDILFPGGAEDGEYLAGEPPCRAGNRPLRSVAELRQVRGMAGEPFESCLAPLLCALQAPTTLNVDTAPAPLLASLDEGLELQQAELLVASRPAGGFATKDDFFNQELLAGTGIRNKEKILDVRSSYFMLESEATVGNGRAVLFSLLTKDGSKVKIQRRSIGVE